MARPDPSPSSADAWLERHYDDLRRIAQGYLRAQRPGLSFQATEVVNEVFLRLRTGLPAGHAIADRHHFIALFCTHMRQWTTTRIGSGDARRRREQASSVVERSTDQQQCAYFRSRLEDVSVALEELRRVDRVAATIVDLRIMGGLTHAQVGRALGIPESTAKKNWARAAAFVTVRLAQLDADERT